MIIVRERRRLGVVLAIAIVAGLTAFGLWHIVIGGLVNGNGRAAGFGAALALVAGSLLTASIVVLRRLPRG